MIRLTDSIQTMILLDDLGVEDRDSAFRAMVEDLARGGHMSTALGPDLVGSLINRAELGPTAIGGGIAVPHAWHPKLDQTVASLGISRKGLVYESLDGEPVHLVLMILSPAGSAGTKEKMGLIEAWVRWLKDPEFVTDLVQADFPEGLRSYLESLED